MYTCWFWKSNEYLPSKNKRVYHQYALNKRGCVDLCELWYWKRTLSEESNILKFGSWMSLLIEVVMTSYPISIEYNFCLLRFHQIVWKNKTGRCLENQKLPELNAADNCWPVTFICNLRTIVIPIIVITVRIAKLTLFKYKILSLERIL